MVGYTPHVEILKRNAYQEVSIKLSPDNLELDEIVVTPGENPAWRNRRNVIRVGVVEKVTGYITIT